EARDVLGGDRNAGGRGVGGRGDPALGPRG
ncbi:MAG: hypothetical protein AVDCRST_MAG05-4549, partial [uncultured Rubrobacteraceae bacterium]